MQEQWKVVAKVGCAGVWCLLTALETFGTLLKILLTLTTLNNMHIIDTDLLCMGGLCFMLYTQLILGLTEIGFERQMQ